MTIETRSMTRRSLDEVPMDVISKIMGFVGMQSFLQLLDCKIVSKTFKDACGMDEVYRRMEVDTLMLPKFWFKAKPQPIFERCRERGNPNMMLIDGMNKYFYVEDDSGKEMLEEASLEGNREATFVLGMLMLAEGRPRQEQALKLLNNAFPISSGRREIIPALVMKVTSLLNWEGRREIRFHGCHLTCHASHSATDYVFLCRQNWIFKCDVCLWAACFMAFARIFGKEYGDRVY